MSARDDIERYRRNIQVEIDSATVYEAVATSESQPQLADVRCEYGHGEAFFRHHSAYATAAKHTPARTPIRVRDRIRYLVLRGNV